MGSAQGDRIRVERRNRGPPTFFDPPFSNRAQTTTQSPHATHVSRPAEPRAVEQPVAHWLDALSAAQFRRLRSHFGRAGDKFLLPVKFNLSYLFRDVTLPLPLTLSSSSSATLFVLVVASTCCSLAPRRGSRCWTLSTFVLGGFTKKWKTASAVVLRRFVCHAPV